MFTVPKGKVWIHSYSTGWTGTGSFEGGKVHRGFEFYQEGQVVPNQHENGGKYLNEGEYVIEVWETESDGYFGTVREVYRSKLQNVGGKIVTSPYKEGDEEKATGLPL